MSDLAELESARSIAARIVALDATRERPLGSNIGELNDVLFSLIMIATRLSRTSADARAVAPEIPFARIRATRNLIVHEPDRVSVSRIETIVARDVPALVRDLDALIERLAVAAPD